MKVRWRALFSIMPFGVALCVTTASVLQSPDSVAQAQCLELIPRGCGNPQLGQRCVFAVANRCGVCKQASVATVFVNGRVSGRQVTVGRFSSVEVGLEAGSGQTSITGERDCGQPQGHASHGVFDPNKRSGRFQLVDDQTPKNGPPAGFQPVGGSHSNAPDQNGAPPHFKEAPLVRFLFNKCNSDAYETAQQKPYPTSCCAANGTVINGLRNPDPESDLAVKFGSRCQAYDQRSQKYVWCTACVDPSTRRSIGVGHAVPGPSQ